MTKVLITGSGSYVGNHVHDWLISKGLNVDILDVQSKDWSSFDFSNYDSIFHVAGIAHRRITKETEPLYYSVNCDLAVSVAKKAKEEGVKQFIFMSSMSVYNDRNHEITESTPTEPSNAYGRGKLKAELSLRELESSSFIVSILRPPMIYGKACRGNYNSLRSIVLRFPFFPKVNNKKSMIYIDNFAEFVYQIISLRKNGIFTPQNSELVNTSEWAELIARTNHHKLFLSKFLGLLVLVGRILPVVGSRIRKAFDDCYYNPRLSVYEGIDYQNVSFIESVERTEQSSF